MRGRISSRSYQADACVSLAVLNGHSESFGNDADWGCWMQAAEPFLTIRHPRGPGAPRAGRIFRHGLRILDEVGLHPDPRRAPLLNCQAERGPMAATPSRGHDHGPRETGRCYPRPDRQARGRHRSERRARVRLGRPARPRRSRGDHAGPQKGAVALERIHQATRAANVSTRELDLASLASVATLGRTLNAEG
jgi:hypothetical protein